jgi:thiol:disulfide interchange protein DsbC
VTATGTYTVTLTDLGRQGGFADPFTSLSVVVTQGSQLAKRYVLTPGAVTGSDTVALAAGSYRLQVLGLTGGASQYGVLISNAANGTIYSGTGSISAPPTRNFATLQQALTLVAGQSYTVQLQDRAFPAPLGLLAMIITQSGAQAGTCRLLAAGSCNFVATGNSAQLTVLATEATGSAGLYSVKVSDGGGGVNFGVTLPVGNMPPPVTLTMPATAGNYTLSSADLAAPVALAAFRLAIAQGAELPVRQLTAGSVPAFAASSGAADLYVIATPVAGSSGLYRIDIQRNGSSVYTKSTAVDSPVPGLNSFVYSASGAAAGSYTLQLRDLAIPQPFVSLVAVVTQGATILGTLTGAGALTVSGAQAGDLVVTVRATTGTGAAAQGLFGVSLTAQNAASALLDRTQGVGGAFTQTTIDVATAQRLSLTITDFAAPAAVGQLIVVLTRGSQAPLGVIFGGGTLSFEATTGSYTVNALAKVSATDGFGSYGASVSAAPTVRLSASAASVTSGSTVSLTWSTEDATTCSASGSWSGSRALSGSVVSSAITANTSYTLTCAGPAGSSAQSVAVSLQASASSGSGGNGGGGGGSFSAAGLLLLSMLAALKLRARRSALLLLVAAAPVALAAAAAAPPQSLTMPQLKARLQQAFSSIEVFDVRPSADWPGLYEVVTLTELAYTNADGSRLMAGQIIDTSSRENLSKQRWDVLNRIDVSKLPLDHAIKRVTGDGRRTLYLFADPDCPYCQELEQQLLQVDNLTIYTFLYPLESLHPDARAKSEHIWCAADRGQAWSEWMLHKVAPTATCAQQVVADNLALGQQLRINSTPTMFLADGSRLTGSMEPAALLAALDDTQNQVPERTAAGAR